MNVSLFRAQSQALNSTFISPSFFIRLSVNCIKSYNNAKRRLATRSWLCTHYPLRAQEPIKSQRSVCRCESTFDPPLNYDENLQKPAKGSRASERIFVYLLRFVRMKTDVCTTRCALLIRNPASSIASSDDDWLSLFETNNYLTIRLLSSPTSDNDKAELWRRGTLRATIRVGMTIDSKTILVESPSSRELWIVKWKITTIESIWFIDKKLFLSWFSHRLKFGRISYDSSYTFLFNFLWFLSLSSYRKI